MSEGYEMKITQRSVEGKKYFSCFSFFFFVFEILSKIRRAVGTFLIKPRDCLIFGNSGARPLMKGLHSWNYCT